MRTSRHRVVKGFLIYQKACSLNVTNCNDGAIFLLFIVCMPPINDVLCILQHILLVPTPGSVM